MKIVVPKNTLPRRTSTLFLIGCVLLFASQLVLGQKGRVKEKVNEKEINEASLVTLNECWHYQSADLLPIEPAHDKANIYVAEDGGRVTAISLAAGTKSWSTELGGEIRSNIVVLGPNIYVVAGPAVDGVAKGSGRLRSLSTVTGITNLDVEVPYSEETRLTAVERKVISISSNGSVMAFDPGSTTPAWQRAFPQIDTDRTTTWADKLALATSDHNIHVISAATGAELATADAGQTISALGVIDNDLVWGDDRGNLVRYDLNKHSIYWKLRNGARISSIASTVGGVIATSLDNFAYLITSYYGSVKWKKRLAGRVSSFALGDSSVAAVQTVGEPNATLLNIENGKSVGQFSIADDESFIEGPVFANGRFIFFTNRQILSRSVSQCTTNKNGDRPLAGLR